MIISADKTGYSPAERNVIEGVQSDVPIVLVTRREGFVFNEELLSFDKWVLCNMSEMGWNFSWDYTPMFGVEWHFSNELFPGEEVTAEVIRAIVVLTQSNSAIWINEDFARLNTNNTDYEKTAKH